MDGSRQVLHFGRILDKEFMKDFSIISKFTEI